MKKWEKHYLHDKAIRDAQCSSLGIPIPDDKGAPEFSFTTPKNLFMKINGQTIKFTKKLPKKAGTFLFKGVCLSKKLHKNSAGLSVIEVVHVSPKKKGWRQTAPYYGVRGEFGRTMLNVTQCKGMFAEISGT